MPTIHLVSHTHWDREWYHLAGRFRQRLVGLIDELLDDPPGGDASFLLDGQTVLLDDYLAVRPERSAELAALLRRGALEAGPWFVLADELIPGAEALVRNLLAGRRVLRALRAEAPPVLYCPDSFGHPAALPALAAGFGFEAAIVWRGFGSRRWPPVNVCWWRAPSGERVLLWHLPRAGYETGADLPVAANAAAARWRELRTELMGRARIGATLLLNGADHHARQHGLAPAVAMLADVASPYLVIASSLAAFAAAAVAEARAADLPEVAGELRDSYGYTWTLQGTLATRAHQKRRAAALERLLVREVEPWTALAARRTGQSRRALVHAAWRELLLCHPHDTLCGCSVDGVARAFDARADEAHAQAAGLRDDALDDLAGHDVEAARRAPADWRAHLVLRNPAPRARGGVAIVSISDFVADVRVGPGSGAGGADGPPTALALPSGVARAGAVQALGGSLAHERLESPRAYPDDDLVDRTLAAVWVPPVPGYGIRALALETGRARHHGVPNPVGASSRRLSNGRLTVDIDAAGVASLRDEVSGRAVSPLLAIEDQDDAGDLYTPAPRGVVRGARFAGLRVAHRGPLRGALETRWRVDVRRGQSVAFTVGFLLDADSGFLRVAVTGENRASDHRLRLRFGTDVPAPVVRADAAFGPVVRTPLSLAPDEAAVEAAPPTAPLHRYVTLSDAAVGTTVYSDGLAEYEVDAQGGVHVTLVRAVGELSRNDLPERPGHAGWPSPTPGAQCPGPFAGQFALLLHGAWGEATADLVERTADDVLNPLAGDTIRSLVAAPREGAGLTLEGGGLAFSAAKESENGDWLVLRCVNLLERPVSGRWVVGGGVREARTSRLDETPGEPLAVAGESVAFEAGPRAVSTVLVR